MRLAVLFLFSRGLSVLGLQILSTSFILSALESGADAYFLGTLGLTATLASLLSAIPLGHGVDRIGRKFAWASSQLILFVFAAVLAIPQAIGSLWIFAGVAALAIFRNYRSISQFSVFGELLTQISNREKWINLSTLSWQIASVIGPFISGCVKTSNARFSLAAFVFGLALICQQPILWRLKEVQTTNVPLNQSIRDIKYFFKGHLAMTSAILLDFGVVLFGSATAIVPFLNSVENLPVAVGALRSAPAIGVILATLTALKVPMTHNWKRGLFIATFGFGTCHLFLASSTHWSLSFFFLIAAGYFDGISLSIREVILQVDTPAHLKGRIYSIGNFLVNASDELGDWESGLAARYFGLRRAIAFGAMITMTISAVFLRQTSLWINKSTSPHQWARRKTSSPLQASN